MTVKELAEHFGLKILAGGNSLDRPVSGGYTGDLLSWVMGRLPADAAWLTVMGNINAIAVASLKDAACMILTDSAPLDAPALEKARELSFPVLLSEQDSFTLGAQIEGLLH